MDRTRNREARIRRKRQLPDPFTYCHIPPQIRGKYIWNEFSIEHINSIKGMGIVAKKDLPANLCIPFGGMYRTLDEWWYIEHNVNTRTNQHLTSHAASLVHDGRNGKKEGGVADAHPRNISQLQLPFNAWPGAYCNQADKPEDQNGELFQHQGKSKAPTYSWIDKRCRNLFVKLTRPVTAGEEVLINYNYSKHKQTRLGFGYDAKLPKIVSNYTLRRHNNDRKYGETKIVD